MPALAHALRHGARDDAQAQLRSHGRLFLHAQLHLVGAARQLAHGGNDLRLLLQLAPVLRGVRFEPLAQRERQALLKHRERLLAAGGDAVALPERARDGRDERGLEREVRHAVVLHHRAVELFLRQVQVGLARKEQDGQLVLGFPFGKNRHGGLHSPPL